MKKKSNMIKKYVEAVLYSVILIISILLCLTDNIYITMFPIAFVIGALGQVILGKRVMTSFFCGILSIIFFQIRKPAVIGENLINSLKIIVLVLIGECFGWAIKRAYRLTKGKKRISKKIKIERSKCISISCISFAVGIIISGIFNGNYFSYFRAKGHLNNYFNEEYHSNSRLKVISCKYMCSLNPKYIFYTQDTLSGNVLGKFSVYLKDNYNVQDDYQEQIVKVLSDELNKEIDSIYKNDLIQVFITGDEINSLTVCFRKQVDLINKLEIENYSKEIEECLEVIRKIDGFEKVEQIKVVFESKNNPKENLASYIFMDGYNEILKDDKEGAYLYIMRALNIEFFN